MKKTKEMLNVDEASISVSFKQMRLLLAELDKFEKDMKEEVHI